jgi:hypothetical protein
MPISFEVLDIVSAMTSLILLDSNIPSRVRRPAMYLSEQIVKSL